MITLSAIGNLGADAEVKTAEGRQFITFRIAHNERYTDAKGVEHSSTEWVDCTMNHGDKAPGILKYLVKGQCIYVQGRESLRLYSSAKDRCMKAGRTIHVQRIELIGGAGDTVPRYLYDGDGVQFDVYKCYFTDKAKSVLLYSRSGEAFQVDKKGFITPYKNEQSQAMNEEGKQDDGTIF